MEEQVYCRMDMDQGNRTSQRGSPHGKRSLIFWVLVAVVIFIQFVMTFVIFGFQERRFSVMEKFMIRHNSSLNSVNSELKGKLTDTGSKLEKTVSELSQSVSSLNSYMDTYNSKLQDQFSSGAQVKQLTDLQTSVNNLGSSLGSLFSKLDTQLQDTAGQQSGQYTELMTLMDWFNTTISELSSKLHSTVKVKDLEEVGESLADLNSSLASFESEQLKRIQDSDLRVVASLNELKANLESIKKPTELQNRILTEMTKLSSLIESLSSNLQSTDQRVMAALGEIKAKLSNPSTVLSCKAKWIPFGSRCYFYSTNTLNWHQARDYCRSQNSFLLTMETDAEWAFVIAKITEAYWVGLTDEVTGQWRWDDGTAYTMNQDQWAPGQPDDWKDHGKGEGGEDCGHLKKDGKLNDSHCSERLKYICRI